MALVPLLITTLLPLIAAAFQNLDAPYVKPTQKITEFVALGDSMTAGLGSNGVSERFGGSAGRGWRSYPFQMLRDLDMWEVINGNREEPRLTFLAHSSDRCRDIVEEQIAHEGWFEDKNWERPRKAHFGHPQLAVMTVGGNDAEFSHVLNSCIYRIWMPKNCAKGLDKIQSQLDDGSMEQKMRDTMLAVVHVGRKARGAIPPESFQLYVPEYVTFFNEMNGQCDRINWHFHHNVFADKAYLTRDLRHRFNLIAAQFNAVLKRAAEGLKDMGVFFVDGIDSSFEGHRFCEFGQTSENMDHLHTWLWSPHMDAKTDGEGRLDGGSTSRWEPSRPGRRDTNEAQARHSIEERFLLEFVFRNKTLNATWLDSETPPWTWPGAEQYPTFSSLINAMQLAETTQMGTLGQQGGIGNLPHGLKRFFRDILLPFRYSRSFHPKGTGYEVFKERIFASLIQNREIPCQNRTSTVITQRLTGEIILDCVPPT